MTKYLNKSFSVPIEGGENYDKIFKKKPREKKCGCAECSRWPKDEKPIKLKNNAY